jgi:DNA-binding MarR family transcriptional regulator
MQVLMQIHGRQQEAALAVKKETGLTLPQVLVLSAVRLAGPCSQTNIVTITGIDRSTASDLVSRLIGKGLVARKRSKEDARAYLVSLTAGGEKVCSSFESKVRKVEAALAGAAKPKLVAAE